MENSFSKRFKSSMKISKNKSIFENLIPIDKSIKLHQIHDEAHLNRDEKNYGKKVKLDYGLFLPPIKTPESSKSSNRISRRSRQSPLHLSYEKKDLSFDNVSKSNSPISIRCKIENDIRRILKSVEKADELFSQNPIIVSSRISRKKKHVHQH